MTLHVTRKFQPIDCNNPPRIAFESTVWMWIDGVVTVGRQNYEGYVRGLLVCHIDDTRVDLATFAYRLHAHNMTLESVAAAIDAQDAR